MVMNVINKYETELRCILFALFVIRRLYDLSGVQLEQIQLAAHDTWHLCVCARVCVFKVPQITLLEQVQEISVDHLLLKWSFKVLRRNGRTLQNYNYVGNPPVQ